MRITKKMDVTIESDDIFCMEECDHLVTDDVCDTCDLFQLDIGHEVVSVYDGFVKFKRCADCLEYFGGVKSETAEK